MSAQAELGKREIAQGLRREAQKLLVQAKELESKAASLFQSAAILDGHEVQLNLPLDPAPIADGGPPPPRAPKGTRRSQVRGLILLAGPLSRAQIREQTGIPKGTLDHLLNEKNGFLPMPDGRWDLMPDKANETAEDVLGI
jgi:hypothetical protein